MAEWLGNGLQNRVQRFDSAWYLKKKAVLFRQPFLVVKLCEVQYSKEPSKQELHLGKIPANLLNACQDFLRLCF
jgi:hypothetical protein